MQERIIEAKDCLESSAYPYEWFPRNAGNVKGPIAFLPTAGKLGPDTQFESPMMIEHQGRQFRSIRGSDVHRNGMFLELTEVGSSSAVLEVFHSDTDGSFSLSGFGSSVPLAVVEQFIASARQLLPPSSAA